MTWPRPNCCCNRIAVIAQGRIVAMGTPAELIAGSGTLEDAILALTGR